MSHRCISETIWHSVRIDKEDTHRPIAISPRESLASDKGDRDLGNDGDE